MSSISLLWIYPTLFIPTWVDGLNKVAMNIHAQTFNTYVLISPGKITKSEVAGSYGKFMFNFMRNWHTISTVVSIPSRNCMPQILSMLGTVHLLIFSYSNGSLVWWSNNDLNCISLMTNNTQYSFLWSLAI